MEIPKLDCMPNNMWHIQNITTGLIVDSKASRIGKDNHLLEKEHFLREEFIKTHMIQKNGTRTLMYCKKLLTKAQ